eukprot:6540273-Prymnesium_polylepis.1
MPQAPARARSAAWAVTNMPRPCPIIEELDSDSEEHDIAHPNKRPNIEIQFVGGLNGGDSDSDEGL